MSHENDYQARSIGELSLLFLVMLNDFCYIEQEIWNILSSAPYECHSKLMVYSYFQWQSRRSTVLTDPASIPHVTLQRRGKSFNRTLRKSLECYFQMFRIHGIVTPANFIYQSNIENLITPSITVILSWKLGF